MGLEIRLPAKTISPLAVSSFVASPVFAEVCDKVRPGWSRESGKVDQIEEFYVFATSYTGIGALLLVLGAVYFKKFWLSAFSAVLLCGVAILALTNWVWPIQDSILEAAHEEGCLASPILTVAIVLAASVFLTIHAGRSFVTNRVSL